MMQFEIPESIFDKFKNEVEKLQRKAVKLQVTAPEYKVVGSSWKEIPNPIDKDEVCMAKFLQIEFDEVNVVLNGWKVVCRIQKNDSNLVGVKNVNNAFYYPYEENIPQDCYHKSPSLCEHCGRNIPSRKTTYILRNVESNEYKQVGSSCVHDFVSSTNNIESILKWISEFTDYVKALASDKFEDVEHKRYYPTKSYLAAIVTMYAEAGFIEEIPPTHNASYRHPSYYEFDKFLHSNPYIESNPKIDAEIEKILEFHRKNFEELNAKESLDVYENKHRNASTAVLAAYMTEDPEYIREFIYAVYLYYKYISKELYVGNNEYLGQIGDTIQVRAKLRENFKHNGNFGEYYLARFLTHDGYKLTAFVPLTNKFALYLERMHIGCEIVFEARVKSHDEYKGDKSTKINYIKNFKLYYPDQKVELGVSS